MSVVEQIGTAALWNRCVCVWEGGEGGGRERRVDEGEMAILDVY